MALSRLAAALAVALAGLAGPAAGVVAAGTGHSKTAAGGRERFRAVATASFIRPIEYKHTLRVCNAYPSRTPLDIFHGPHGNKITQSPLQYKDCEEFGPPTMKNGDKLEFRLGEKAAGSFDVSELPNDDAVLLLVIYRHDVMSTAVAFESHVFANLINSQIAVLNTFKGTTKATLRIQDGSNAETSRSEELRYDSVVAINPGLYEIVAKSEDGQTKARQELVALNRESYVVIRAGVEVEQGESWPQELIVYPRSDLKVLKGSAFAGRSGFVPVLAALIVALRTLLL